MHYDKRYRSSRPPNRNLPTVATGQDCSACDNSFRPPTTYLTQHAQEYHITKPLSAMESAATDATEPQLPAFRSGKKRKIYRHRSEDDDSPLDAPIPTAQTPATSDPRPSDDAADSQDVEEHLPLSAIRRQARKARLGGVAFRAGSTRADDHTENTEQSLVRHDGSTENPVIAGIRNRFAPQTGLVGELVNKHM